MKTTELTKKHNRKKFDCGTDELNHYLKIQARQQTERGISRTYVLAEQNGTSDIIGFYTLTLSELIAPLGSHLHNKNPNKLPVLKIARLAVDLKSQEWGIGSFLLMDVMNKAIQAHSVAPIIGVVVDAKDQAAKDFYLPYGFIELPGNNDKFFLFLPIKTIERSMA